MKGSIMKKIVEYKPKYQIQSLNFGGLYKTISKPKIQRGAVWTQRKQNELIETIKKGLPIGTFLLLRTKGKYAYEVLDGQQRYTTLCNYKENVSLFMRKDDLDIKELLKTLMKETSDKGIKESLKTDMDNVNKISRDFFRMFKSNKGEINSTTKDIVKYFRVKKKIHKKEILRNFEHVINYWVEKCDDKYEVDGLILPCIVLDEKLSNDEKADAFITMNIPGVKLTKYDYYAAKWTKDRVKCDDKEIIEIINDRYNDKYNKQVKYTNVKEYSLFKENLVEVFECVYAIAKIVDNTICDELCESIDKDNAVKNLGFILVSETLGIESSKMDELPKALIKIRNITDYKNKLVYSVKMVFEELKSSFTAPDGRAYLDHTDNQIASFIISFFKLNYEIKPDGKIVQLKSGRKDTQVLFSHMIEHYIYDNLNDFWSGTGDRKMSNISKNVMNSKYMLSGVDKKVMKNKLEEWFADKNTYEDVNPTNDTKMFISYILNSKGEKTHSNMQWEHICIKDKLLDSKCKRGMSSPACITLIPQYDNGSKGKLTYYEYEKNRDSAMKLDKKVLSNLLYPTEKELKFVQGATKKHIDATAFEVFKSNRTKELINLFMDIIYK